MRTFFVLILILGALSACQKQENPYALLPSGKKISLEIAKTAIEKEIGLMNRLSLEENSGMLFVYEEPRILSFWMKNTLIPLDIIFLDQEKKIVSIETMLPCPKQERNCPITLSKKEGVFALEVNQGKAMGWNLKEGDSIQLYYPNHDSPGQ